MFETIDLATTLVGLTTSVILGLIIALFYMYKNTYSKSFVVTLVLLPSIVMAVISLVNGSVGTGIAVMGAFSLVRFRSIPGSAKEIGFIFFAMAVGLATGMNYIGYAIIFTLFVGLTSFLLYTVNFGESNKRSKQLKITIPEDVDYSTVFVDLFEKYTSKNNLMKVRTTNLGSLYQLHYEIILKDPLKEKEFIDQIRCRNSNLNISCGQFSDGGDVL